MNYDESFIDKVRSFGVLQYPAHEIVYLVEPEDPEQFIQDMSDPESDVYKAYQKGKMTGQYTADKALFDALKNNNIDANEKLQQRQDQKRIATAIHERFNI